MVRSAHLAVLAALAAFSCAAQAAVVFSDDFSGVNLSKWDAKNDYWGLTTNGSLKYAHNYAPTGATPLSLAANLKQTITDSWSVSLDYDWMWGGNPSNGTGAYGNCISAQMLDSAGNGYAVVIHQGTLSNQPANKLLQIYKVDANVLGTEALASGAGYDRNGWAGSSLTQPRFSNVELTWDKSTGELTVYYYLGGVKTESVSVINTSYSSFSQLSITTFGWTAAEQPQLDNVLVQTVPEASSMGLLALGAIALLRRR